MKRVLRVVDWVLIDHALHIMAGTIIALSVAVAFAGLVWPR